MTSRGTAGFSALTYCWGAHFNKSEEWEVPHTFPLGGELPPTIPTSVFRFFQKRFNHSLFRPPTSEVTFQIGKAIGYTQPLVTIGGSMRISVRCVPRLPDGRKRRCRPNRAHYILFPRQHRRIGLLPMRRLPEIIRSFHGIYFIVMFLL